MSNELNTIWDNDDFTFNGLMYNIDFTKKKAEQTGHDLVAKVFEEGKQSALNKVVGVSDVSQQSLNDIRGLVDAAQKIIDDAE